MGHVVSAADAFVQSLIREGVDTAFGIASGYLSPFLDAMRRAGVRAITNLHEGASAFAAAGHALASGQLAVVYTQAGPGVTNAATGVAAAYADSVPMLLLATQSPTNLYGADAHQEATGATHAIDQLDMYRSASAVQYRPMTAEAMIRCTRRAFAAAQGRRSTAVVEVAADLWNTEIPHDDLAPAEYRSASTPIDRDGLAQVAVLLREARRPALLVGSRAVHRGASAELVKFCEAQDLPCATVDFAKGAIPEDHPLSLGILGSCGHESAEDYFRQADLVIALGTRMSSQTTFDLDASCFPNLVHIDDLIDEPGRNLRLRLGIQSSLATVSNDLRVACGEPVRRGSVERVRELRAQHCVYTTDTGRGESTTPAVLAMLRTVMPRETLVTGDSGLTLQYLKKFFPVYAPDGFYALYSMAAMGSGLPLAIGVQLARPNTPVLCVIGDGGILVHLSELAVAAHYQLPLVVVVCNNGSYKQVADRMDRYQTTSYGCALPPVDFVAVARACGCDGYLATDAQSAATAVKTALERHRPSLIEVKVEGDNIFDITPPRIKEWWDRMFGGNDGARPWPFPR